MNVLRLPLHPDYQLRDVLRALPIRVQQLYWTIAPDFKCTGRTVPLPELKGRELVEDSVESNDWWPVSWPTLRALADDVYQFIYGGFVAWNTESDYTRYRRGQARVADAAAAILVCDGDYDVGSSDDEVIRKVQEAFPGWMQVEPEFERYWRPVDAREEKA